MIRNTTKHSSWTFEVKMDAGDKKILLSHDPLPPPKVTFFILTFRNTHLPTIHHRHTR
jgi:hypothetical protein